MKFTFGMVVTADYLPETRMMLLYRNPDWPTAREKWWAMVLRDDATEGTEEYNIWFPGDLITLSPDEPGLRIVDTPEGSE